jgi:hypothetical protein
MRRLLVAWILVCSIGTLGYAQAEQTKNESSHKQEKTASNAGSSAQNTQAQISPAQAVADKKTQEDKCASNEHIGKRERSVRWVTTDVRITDVAMVILTLAYVLVTTFLLLAVRKQVEIATSGERAWLFEDDVPQYYLKQAPGTTGCNVGYRNFGKSPAWITSAAGSFQWIESDSQLSRRPIYAHINLGDFAPILAGENRNFLVTNQIGNLPRDDKSRLAVFVSISYYDRFTVNGNPRTLKYCFMSTDKSLRLWNIKAGPRGYNEYT